jgi:hypothetical protein
MAQGQFTGNVIVRRDGQSLRAKNSKATIDLGGFERIEEIADNKVVGYRQKPVAAQVSLTVVHDSTLDLIALNNDTNVTLEFECDSGPVFIVTNAFLTKPPELVGGEGDVMLVYKGKAALAR